MLQLRTRIRKMLWFVFAKLQLRAHIRNMYWFALAEMQSRIYKEHVFVCVFVHSFAPSESLFRAFFLHNYFFLQRVCSQLRFAPSESLCVCSSNRVALHNYLLSISNLKENSSNVITPLKLEASGVQGCFTMQSIASPSPDANGFRCAIRFNSQWRLACQFDSSVASRPSKPYSALQNLSDISFVSDRSSKCTFVIAVCHMPGKRGHCLSMVFLL